MHDTLLLGRKLHVIVIQTGQIVMVIGRGRHLSPLKRHHDGFPEFLSKTEATSPKMLADAIVAFSLAACGKSDDMTVAVIEISENE